jgi:nucleoside-diphosphate-sugar epimerase
MKLVVTGANGFVGKALCQKLISDGHQVLSLTRQAFNLPGVRNEILPTHDSTLVNLLSGYDCIFHLAAKTHSGTKATAENLEAYRNTNVNLSCQLAKAAIAAHVPRFVYLSSIKVNGEQTFDKPFSHLDIPAPEDAYGISKMEAEIALHKLCDNSLTSLVIVRPPLIWNREELKGNLALLSKLISWRVPLPLKGWNNRRDLVSLENLCDFLSLCTYKKDLAGETFLISDGQPYSTLDIAKLIGKPFSFRLPQRLYRLLSKGKKTRKLFGNLEVDISHTTQTTGWKPTKSY